jgi:hypothetical protein
MRRSPAQPGARARGGVSGRSPCSDRGLGHPAPVAEEHGRSRKREPPGGSRVERGSRSRADASILAVVRPSGPARARTRATPTAILTSRKKRWGCGVSAGALEICTPYPRDRHLGQLEELLWKLQSPQWPAMASDEAGAAVAMRPRLAAPSSTRPNHGARSRDPAAHRLGAADGRPPRGPQGRRC